MLAANPPSAQGPKMTSALRAPTVSLAALAVDTPDTRWRDVFGRILRIEGGYVDDPKDRGGATKYGISLRFLVIEGKVDLNRDGRADYDLDLDGDITARDVQLLQPRHAEALYRRVFWEETGFHSLSRPYDAALFDLGVNAGTGRAVKTLQRALNDFGAGLAVDGQLGPRTRGALTEQLRAGRAVLQGYRKWAAEFYCDIVDRDPSQRRFLKGWLRRAEELGRV